MTSEIVRELNSLHTLGKIVSQIYFCPMISTSPKVDEVLNLFLQVYLNQNFFIIRGYQEEPHRWESEAVLTQM